MQPGFMMDSPTRQEQPTPHEKSLNQPESGVSQIIKPLMFFGEDLAYKNYRRNSILDGNESDDDCGLPKNFHSLFDYQEYNKKLGNLAAINCWATISGFEPYQKTYQDKLKVGNLVDNIYSDKKPLNIDKLFSHQDQIDPNLKDCQDENLLSRSHSGNGLKSGQVFDNSFYQLGPDIFMDTNNQDSDDLHRLFEDPIEKQQRIKMSIAASQRRKRQRINSCNSHQSKKSVSCQKCSKSENFEVPNLDLLKQFQKQLEKSAITFEKIQNMFSQNNMVQKIINSFEESKKNLRIEDPLRILTRFAFDFITNLVTDQSSQDSLLTNMNNQLEQLQVFNNPLSDQCSVTAASLDNLPKDSVSNNVKKYKLWSEKEEQKLMDLVAQKQKQFNELNDTDWSDLALKLNAVPQQIQWKAKRLIKSDNKVQIAQQPMDQPNARASRREMVTQALMQLPGQKGSKKDILKKIEQLFKLNLGKDSSIYKSVEQALSKFFNKTPQEYCLSPDFDIRAFQLQDISQTTCMKSMIIQALISLRGHKGEIKDIKSKMSEIFGKRLELSLNFKVDVLQWEKTVLKTIARHKQIFKKNKALFSLSGKCGGAAAAATASNEHSNTTTDYQRRDDIMSEYSSQGVSVSTPCHKDPCKFDQAALAPQQSQEVAFSQIRHQRESIYNNQTTKQCSDQAISHKLNNSLNLTY